MQTSNHYNLTKRHITGRGNNWNYRITAGRIKTSITMKIIKKSANEFIIVLLIVVLKDYTR